jgi:type II secretory pathway pseudopilin PulG
VVAIIAILAAIAVPNFLEAQVRSKVSRVKADMRSVATALEAYYVDYNKYPAAMEAFSQVNWSAYAEPPFHARTPSLITTPVAYMTSIPNDPFRENIAGTQLGSWVQNFKSRPVYFNMQYFRSTFPNSFTTPTSSNFSRAEVLGGTWFLYSVGPDKDEFNRNALSEPLVSRAVYRDYDPTNGTVSTGNIFRSQKSGERLGVDPFFY